MQILFSLQQLSSYSANNVWNGIRKIVLHVYFKRGSRLPWKSAFMESVENAEPSDLNSEFSVTNLNLLW